MTHDNTLKLTPSSLLFMRDGRPMEDADVGHGANWPRPDQLWYALEASFWRLWPSAQPWEQSQEPRMDAANRFQNLVTAGPFPMKKGPDAKSVCYFPTPLDLCIDDQGELVPMTLQDGAGTDLPKPLKYVYVSSVVGKEQPPSWLSAEDYRLYLKSHGRTSVPLDKDAEGKVKKPELFETERSIGVTISPQTHAAVDGHLYQAEYLRFRDGVSMVFQGTCQVQDRRTSQSTQPQTIDLFSQFQWPSSIIMGGQQGTVTMDKAPEFSLPSLAYSAPAGEPPYYLRWTLLTPAIFPALAAEPSKGVKGTSGGWLPSWIDADDGKVMLRTAAKELPRLPNEKREAWRRRCQGELLQGARLIAARIGKPVSFSGWDLVEQCPKPTVMAVPAGSVYLFECDSAADAQALWNVLNCYGKETAGPVRNRRSGNSGEKGFGIGVCSFIEFNR